MSNISAKLVKELRERTGAGMMECKKALVATEGDIEKAAEEMRISGQAKADKKASRVAAEGVIEAYAADGRAVLIEINSETDFVARDDSFKAFATDIAMHVAAVNPMVVSGEDVPADVVAKEKEIFTAQAKESGKPAEIIEKMIGGRIRKFLDEVALLGQAFVKDPNVKVEQLVKQNNAKVVSFIRLDVGEGIEKKEEDFAAEVMNQIKG
ncbi:UNVERIFIED_CONTAM: hypothetical protein GTU68_061991 [Idotea baltica]|nr:hypothetical protein [Idotea baltica]